jgi:hypothetical protein
LLLPARGSEHSTNGGSIDVGIVRCRHADHAIREASGRTNAFEIGEIASNGLNSCCRESGGSSIAARESADYMACITKPVGDG